MQFVPTHITRKRPDEHEWARVGRYVRFLSRTHEQGANHAETDVAVSITTTRTTTRTVPGKTHGAPSTTSLSLPTCSAADHPGTTRTSAVQRFAVTARRHSLQFRGGAATPGFASRACRKFWGRGKEIGEPLHTSQHRKASLLFPLGQGSVRRDEKWLTVVWQARILRGG
jgi:hypothetical protein